MKKPHRKDSATHAEHAAKRDAYAKYLLTCGLPKSKTETVIVEKPVERVVERRVEVPVDRVVEKVVHVDNPDTLRALEEAQAKLDAVTHREPRTEVPPADLADLFRINESYERANERLTARYIELNHKAELARSNNGVFDGRRTVEWLEDAKRFESGINWNRTRMVETV